MDKKLKAKWVKALRSGKYEQGRYMLRHNNEYCCLGVLCRVAGVRIVAADGILPSQFRERAKISIKREGALIGMNDTKRLPFSKPQQ